MRKSLDQKAHSLEFKPKTFVFSTYVELNLTAVMFYAFIYSRRRITITLRNRIPMLSHTSVFNIN
jgi:hypothetical protein